MKVIELKIKLKQNEPTLAEKINQLKEVLQRADARNKELDAEIRRKEIKLVREI